MRLPKEAKKNGEKKQIGGVFSGIIIGFILLEIFVHFV